MNEETRSRKIMINKAGGSAGKESVNYRISLPAPWMHEMGINEDNKDVEITFKDGKIIISKED